MDNNWIIDNLNYAFGVWNDKLTEMWSLLSQSPQAFKGGTIWQTIQTVNGATQGIGYGLLVLFLAIGIFRSSASFRDFQRPEHVLRHFIYFVMAKLAVTYGIDLMTFSRSAPVSSPPLPAARAVLTVRPCRCLRRWRLLSRMWASLPVSPCGW